MSQFGFCPQCRRCDNMDRFPKCARCKSRPRLVSPSDTFFHEIFVEGKRPTQAELLELQSCAFGPAHMNDVEHNVAKKKLGKSVSIGLCSLVLGLMLLPFSTRMLRAGMGLYGMLAPVRINFLVAAVVVIYTSHPIENINRALCPLLAQFRFQTQRRKGDGI